MPARGLLHVSDHGLVDCWLRAPPQVLVQQLQHLILVQTLLLHVRSELRGARVHQVHDLIVHVRVDLVPLPGGELHQQVPLLKGRVAKANQGALSNPLPALGL